MIGFLFWLFKVTTINGAMVLPDKKDILIPQGVAHSVDRVMFPLPVGDILQTLQSDRERRFTNFLRALFSSGLSELLQNKGQLSFEQIHSADTIQSFSFLFQIRQVRKRTPFLHRLTQRSAIARRRRSILW